MPHLSIRSGFTSSELVTGIALLGLIIVILLPVGAQVQENSRRSSCQSNLKRIGQGIAQYAQDHDKRLPASYYGSPSRAGVVNSWRRQIFPYLKNTQVFACPSNPANGRVADDSTDTNVKAASLSRITPRFSRSYVCNGQIDWSRRNPTEIGGTPPMEINNGQSLSVLVDSSHTILVAEGGNIGQAQFPMTGPMLDLDVFPEKMFEGHLETCNFLFADGHVEALAPYSTGVPLNMWNIEKTHSGYPLMMGRLRVWDEKVRDLVGQVQ